MSSRNRQRQDPLWDDAPLDHKTSQLCEQVGETLTLVLADCGDPLLTELSVVSVTPRRGAGQLLVTVISDRPGQRADRIIETLERACGYLRHEIGQDIHRKRVPELSFGIALPAATTTGSSSVQ